MKANACCILLAVSAGFISVLVAGQTESALPGGNSALMDSPHPALAGIDSLRVRILRGGSDRNANGLDWTGLYAKVVEKFNTAGVKLNSEIAQSTPNSPELRIYIEVLKLEDSTTEVFRIQTSLARAVRLTEKRNPVFKAELWQASPVMQAVSADDLPATVTDVVVKQVEAFILTCQVSNPPNGQPSEDRTKQADSPMPRENGPEPEAGSGVTEHQYIASSSSSVFHRPGCRWAQNISAENRIGYDSREEAVKAGKRPCKSCNP